VPPVQEASKAGVEQRNRAENGDTSPTKETLRKGMSCRSSRLFNGSRGGEKNGAPLKDPRGSLPKAWLLHARGGGVHREKA